ncbi:hypothetical protein FRC19_009800 [Serendipita sp. 401]|nr:hypothetical protein FRC19_009800 [Serendipita sp. 401]
MSRRTRAQSQTASGNSKAQLIAAYNELGKELSDTRLRVIGNYNIGRIIGEGSYGKVRLGTHRLTGTRVALKQIPKSVSAQLTREIHHHRQLHHSNIVQLYEVIATETSIWLVTELCTGGELFDYLVEKGRIDEHEARLLFGQLCLAVAYCHDQGVVHRDLKLENVLLDDRTQIKLSDFGFTREFERGTLLETFCGTTGYASPEMLQGQKYLGQEVDIWSLGIILYTLLVGALPFDDDDEEETKRKIIASTYEIPEWMSSEARELLEGILVQEPSKRLSLQQILSSSWFSKTMLPMSPPAQSSAMADLSDIEKQSSDMPQLNEVTNNPRSSTPPNRTEGTPGLVEEARRTKSFDRDSNTSPSRPGIDRRNSAQSIVPPLPTRTPVRTKRRSVSSTISPSNSPKPRPSSALFSATEQPDFINAMSQQTAVVFSTPQERAMLSSLSALGFDTGQVVHSVLSNACDSAGALWWILRKKVGETYPVLEEPNASGLVIADPFLDSSLDDKSKREVATTNGVDQEQGVSTSSDRPTVFLEEVDVTKKRKRHQDAAAPPVESQPKKAVRDVISTPPPDFTIVPATPVLAEEASKHQGKSSPTRNLSPTRVSTSTSVISSSLHSGSPSASTPNSSKIYSNKARSGSISMLQRATTVLGGAAGLVRKKSEEGGITNSSAGNRDRSNDEPRSSGGSGGRLTKSPPPGKISREAKDRERQNSSESASIARSASASIPTPATYPGHVKSKSSQTRRAVTEGGRSPSPVVTRDGGKQRNRVSILNTFRGLWDEGWRRKHKIGPNGTPSNSPAGVMVISPQSSSQGGYFGPDRPGSTLPERPYTPRKRGSMSKARRGHRSHKDKRPSISSRRSSSINSRRSSVASMASLVKQGGTLGSVGEYTVYNGAPLTRKISDNSRQSLGTKTPLEEDSFDPSRPGSAFSYSQGASMSTGIGKRGKRHSKSSSTSSGGSLRRHAGPSNRPPSRSGTTSPLPTGHAHRRVGSGSSQTRVVKQYVKKSSSISKSLEAASEMAPLENEGTKRVRSGSVSSTRSADSSVLEADGEFGGRRATSPINRSIRSVMVAQKKASTYGSPSNSLGLSGRSSWKKSWGQEPPSWAHRATRQEVIVEILDPRHQKGVFRDVFANGGKSGAPSGTALPDDEDDWSDVEDELGFAGGLGQLNSAHNLSTSPSGPNNLLIDSPLMVFSGTKAGRRSNRNPMSMSQFNKTGNSPTQTTVSSPIVPSVQSPPTTMEGLGPERNSSRRQLPGARTNFRSAAIVEEEEEEEEE